MLRKEQAFTASRVSSKKKRRRRRMAKTEPPWVRATKDILAGTVGGIAIVFVGHPFDTVKVRLQTQSTTSPVYLGPLDCVRKTAKWEGIRGFYKGVGSPLVGQMFFRAFSFLTYGTAITDLKGDSARLSLEGYFLAGLITGGAIAFVEGPIDFFKSQIQVQLLQQKSGTTSNRPQYKGVFDCAKDVISRYGIRGAYQGLGATLLRNIPANSAYFGFNEATRRFFAEGRDTKDLPPSVLLMAGGFGGFMYWILTYPTDVIKSSMQSDHVDRTKRQFKNMWDCMKQLYKEGGILRFYRGLTPCLLRSGPANATMWLVYEKTRSLMS